MFSAIRARAGKGKTFPCYQREGVFSAGGRLAAIGGSRHDPQPAQLKGDRVLVMLAAVLCTTAAGWAYSRFLAEPQRLWGRMDHDRNTHYLAGLRLGLDLRHGRLIDALLDVHRLRTWPPLHPLLVAATTCLAGADYRWAVLPNVAAWGASIWLMFLIARRVSPSAGTLAGTAAAFWMLTSPAHRAFACDLMLESLGTMLTLLAVHSYLAARARGQGMSRMLALSLTLLFYAKYNYWLLALAAVASCEAARHRALLRGLAASGNVAGLGRWLARQWRRPLSWMCGVLAAMCAGSLVLGPEPRVVWGDLRLGGMNQNLWHLAFLALVARIAVHWREEGAQLWRRLPPGSRVFALWHVVPSAAWFLLPKRLGYFVWYLSPENGPNSEGGWLAALNYYWACAQDDYHVTAWTLAAAASLALAAFWCLPKLRPGAGVLLALLVLGTVLAAKHPNRKSRFLHTWLPAAWAAAGAGLASLASGAGRGGYAQQAAGWCAVAALWALGSRHLADRPAVPDSGNWPFESSLAVSRQWLPWLREGEPHAIFANLPVEDFATWTYLAAFPSRHPPEVVKRLMGPHPSITSQRFEHWLQTTNVQRLVYLDVHPASPLYFPGFALYRQVGELLEHQTVFRRSRRVSLEPWHCTISLWERAPPSPTRSAAVPVSPHRYVSP
ncbi:MAG: glycosyltransferase family 39 protein [Pirellulales bacterium]|nr:glycosyltransferase family 39 protein [Pirellulales bacterium]